MLRSVLEAIPLYGVILSTWWLVMKPYEDGFLFIQLAVLFVACLFFSIEQKRRATPMMPSMPGGF